MENEGIEKARKTMEYFGPKYLPMEIN